MSRTDANLSGESIFVAEHLRLGVEGREPDFDPVVDASLRVNRGEVVAVVGESGSGKSLSLRGIAGLLPTGIEYRGGSVRFGDISVTSGDRRTLRELHGGKIGFVFQEPRASLSPTMKIGPQIAEGARAHRAVSRSEARKRALELLERMGFPDPERTFRSYPHELSGGMCQRVMIAVALAGEPALLLCDEPTTALDATVTMRVLDLLVGLVADFGVAIVLVTHDLGVAARISDRIVVMYAGRIVEEGPADEVLRRPRHPYTLALLRAVPTRETTIADLDSLPGLPPAPGEILAGCPFAPRCGFARPDCAEPVALEALGGGRASACRHHELLAQMVEKADD